MTLTVILNCKFDSAKYWRRKTSVIIHTWRMH